MPRARAFIAPNGQMARWPNGEMAKWRDGQMARWPNGQMTNWPTPSSLLSFQHPRHRSDELLPQRTPVPVRERHLVALRAVVEVIGSQSGGDRLVANRQVHLVVVFEGAVVEIGGSNCGPQIVDDEHLGVNHSGFVFVDANARLQQLA